MQLRKGRVLETTDKNETWFVLKREIHGGVQLD